MGSETDLVENDYDLTVKTEGQQGYYSLLSFFTGWLSWLKVLLPTQP